MNTHKINSHSHSDFLNEKRQDPITGDLIVEGDEIVFCQECKSAFLKSSWEYLNEKHCNQNRTLAIFPVKKTLNLKSKRQYFKAYLHSISDWKQFDTQLKTLPWVLSSLDMESYIVVKNTEGLSTTTFLFLSTTILLTWIVCFLKNLFVLPIFLIGILVILSLLGTVMAFFVKGLNEPTKSVENKTIPAISIEKDQIIIFMPYKEQKVTLAKYKVEEIELVPKEDSNYKLRISYKGGTMFFSMYLHQNSLSSLVETLYNWSNTVKIDLTKVKFSVTDYSYLYASLDADDENPNLLLPSILF